MLSSALACIAHPLLLSFIGGLTLDLLQVGPVLAVAPNFV